jgi:BatD DUF11 like domain
MKYVIAALLLITFDRAAVAQQPVVRARLQPTQGIMVGQPVRLTVSVLVPNYFTGSPDFPEFEIENAIVVLPQDRPQNINQKIGGVAYAGITETYTIYPQQPGTFQLPPAQIAVSYASAPPKSTNAHVALPQLRFQADIPAEAKDLSYFLPTTRLTMQQKWSRPLTHVQTGDSIERTITVTATKMQGMVIPPLPFDAPAGIRVYPDEPAVQDQKSDHGEFLFGRRTQSAKYFIEKEGDYQLPAIELKWWNLSTRRIVIATLPAVHFTAVANPDFSAELPPPAETAPVQAPRPLPFWRRYRFWIRVVLPLVLACLLVLLLAWKYVPRLWQNVRTWQKRRNSSEAACFRRFISACRRNDARTSYHLLLRWLAVSLPGLSVQEFLSRTADPDLSSQLEFLGAALYSPDTRKGQWRGDMLAAAMTRHRKTQQQSVQNRSVLAQLNP